MQSQNGNYRATVKYKRQYCEIFWGCLQILQRRLYLLCPSILKNLSPPLVQGLTTDITALMTGQELPD